MNLATLFFIVVLLVIVITFIFEVIKPKWDASVQERRFKSRDDASHNQKREELLLNKQEELTVEAREKKERKERLKAQQAIQMHEKYSSNPPSKHTNIKESEVEVRQRKKAEEKNRKKERAQQLRDHLPPEPISSADNSNQITSIQIKLPARGKPLYRKFFSTDTLQTLVDYIDSTELIDKEYTLAIPYPKRPLRDLSLTMAEAGLHPNASLVVQEHDL